MISLQIVSRFFQFSFFRDISKCTWNEIFKGEKTVYWCCVVESCSHVNPALCILLRPLWHFNNSHFKTYRRHVVNNANNTRTTRAAGLLKDALYAILYKNNKLINAQCDILDIHLGFVILGLIENLLIWWEERKI